MASKEPKSQRERFEQTARELRVEMDEAKLKEALRTLALERSVPKAHVKTDQEKSGGEPGNDGDA